MNFSYVFEYFELVGSVEGMGTFKHKEEDESYGVDIGLGTIGVSLQHFRSLVGKHSNHLFSFQGHHGVFHVDGLTEV